MINPFSKTFGREPSNYIERDIEKENIIDDFSSSCPTDFAYLICGPRGSGKTVLMSSISSYFKTFDDWIVVDPGPKENLLENIAARLYENAKLKTKFLKGEFSFSFQGISFSLKGEQPITTAFVLLSKMCEILKKKKKRILITIDEVDNSKEMKTFIEAYQTLIREQNDVVLLMTGLYENVSKLQDNPSLTFLYRAPKITLGALSLTKITANYETILAISHDEALECAKTTKGYAYAYQVLGFLLFNQEKRKIDKMLLASFDDILSEHVYQKIYSSLSDKEQIIIKSFNCNEPVKMSTLVERTNMNIKTISVYRDRLIKIGLVKSPKYGYLEFTLPRFNEFLNNQY